MSQLLSSHGYLLHAVQLGAQMEHGGSAGTGQGVRHLAPSHRHYSTSQTMGKLATLLLTEWLLSEHRQLYRQEIGISIIHGKRHLLYELIPKQSL